MKTFRSAPRRIAAILILLLATAPAVLADDWLAEGQKLSSANSTAAGSSAPLAKPLPISFSVEYTLVSDYIWRGINLSQSPSGARKGVNHQLNIGAELDLGQAGRLGGSVWLEWFSAQDQLTPAGGTNLQEVDFTAYYGYTFESIGLDVELGFIYYAFPAVGSGDDGDQDLYLCLSYDDSRLWRALGFDCTEPVLNPSLTAYVNLDAAKGSSFYEFSLSHDFACGDVTITPSWAMAWDHNSMGTYTGNGSANSSQMDYMNWGLSATIDLKSALKIPDNVCGECTVTGFMNYSQSLNDTMLNDYFYGGVSVGMSW
ncbi:MAG: hypothetical protein HN909_02755 [Phycisphaerales bacterium]|jgi:hypothetical protein|nr:hypothetical protein [Phycisphaerales bacterium]MBT7170672.1 hypothetical protein [Phycisphaerales bacterium]